jgi:hypothetical protein
MHFSLPQFFLAAPTTNCQVQGFASDRSPAVFPNADKASARDLVQEHQLHMYARIEKECGGESASLNIAGEKFSKHSDQKALVTTALAPIALQQVSLDYNYPGGGDISREHFSKCGGGGVRRGRKTGIARFL